MLPDGFKLAPQERWTEEIKEETEGVYFTNYSEEKDNIIIVGPLPGDTNKEIVFPVLSPDPSTNKEYHYGKYSLHIGGNRGRGQQELPHIQQKQRFCSQLGGTEQGRPQGRPRAP